MALNTIALLLILLLVAVGVGATFVIIGTQLGNNENATQVQKSLNTIYIVNGVMVGIFTILNWFVIKDVNGAVHNTYMFFLVHAALLFGFTALGVSLISKGV